MNGIDKDQIRQAFQMAEDARSNSYSPYSNFKVGACLKTRDNLFFQGSNVENASFGATCCAERGAIVSMISSVGIQRIDFMLLSTIPETIPCAICLQVMSEFFDRDTKILITNPLTFNSNKSVLKAYTLRDLLKIPFDKEEMSRISISK
ncbi:MULTISPECIES: cytidine deaminase [unclassified Borrelia]|uniref:cytidine deaminase n=1 Tax=unclassified Borrelia TaxID=2649934 RepID=UPI001E434DA0|nr:MULTISPECIES: cytidine deaminase [unclassified Borrelia]UGQ16282.1 cytidine deaminase [Borrelia sp. RT5S]UGQ17401.1 cytidine deaminase [Borrelia sp. RT1S]